MYKYIPIISSFVLQILLLLTLPSLNFLLRPIIQSKKRFFLLALFWTLCTIVWFCSIARIAPFSFRTGVALLLILIYAVLTSLILLIIYKICCLKLAKHNAQHILRIIALPIFSLWFVYGLWATYSPHVIHYSSTINKTLNQPIKIALIADLHLGNLIANRSLKRLNKILEKEKPDIVLLAGDIMDDTIDKYRQKNMQAELRKIASSYPVYAVLGNHDNYRGIQKEISDEMKAAGIICLRDESILFRNQIWITGRRDKQEKQRLQPEKLMTTAIKQSSLAKIVIDHQPINAKDNANAGFDLQLSGHTHAGQVFPATLLVNLFQDFVHGKYTVGNMQLFVTSGYGVWGIPLRIGTRSEVMIINLAPK